MACNMGGGGGDVDLNVYVIGKPPRDSWFHRFVSINLIGDTVSDAIAKLDVPDDKL